jgi:hypothetical protein
VQIDREVEEAPSVRWARTVQRVAVVAEAEPSARLRSQIEVEMEEVVPEMPVVVEQAFSARSVRVEEGVCELQQLWPD